MWNNPAVIFLLLANLFPIYGIVFWGWGVFYVIFLYWLENVIIGVFNVLRMLLVEPENKINWAIKVFLIPFFTVHYGGFCFGHGIFVILLFGKDVIGEVPNTTFPLIVALDILKSTNFVYAVYFLLASHGFSFFYNYLYKKEYQMTSLQKLMIEPYKRIVILHIGIIAGGFLVMALNSATFAMILLVAAKIVIDILSHISSHKRMRAAKKTS